MLNVSDLDLCIPQCDVLEKSTLIRIVQALVRERLIPYQFQNGNLIFERPDRTQSILVTEVKMTALNRCIGFECVFAIKGGEEGAITTLHELFECVYGLIDDFVERSLWERFCTEVKNHQYNMLIECHPLVEHHTPSLFYEQIVSYGHPFHPCSKTKIGFSEEDVTHYCPEFAPEFDLRVLAVGQACSEFSHSSFSADNYSEWFKGYFREEYSEFRNEIISLGLLPDDYFPIPCHPWQLEHVVADEFSQHIKDDQLLLLENARISVSPTLSFRTLKPLSNPRTPYIKLPLNVQATSSLRILKPKSIHATPMISDCLEEVFEKENNFNGTLYMLREMCGLHIKSGKDCDKQLGVLYRRSVDDLMADDEEAMVVASLFSVKPDSKFPLIVEVMKKNDITSNEGVISFFYEYAEKVIRPLVTLSLCYGLSLEAHQQNTLVVLRNGHPGYFVARDFEGIDVYYHQAKHIFKKDIKEIDCFVSEDSSIGRNNLLHTAFQCHLGELILLLEKYFNVFESTLWQCVSEITIKIMNDIKHRIDPDYWEQEYQAMLFKPWFCRSLLRMRLESEYDRNGIGISIKNPLSAWVDNAV